MDFDIEPPMFATRVIPGSPPDELPWELNPRSLREHGASPRPSAEASTLSRTPVLPTTSALSGDVPEAASAESVTRTLSFRDEALDGKGAEIEPNPERPASVEALSTCLKESHHQQRRQVQEFQSARKQWQDEVESLQASLQHHLALSSHHQSALKMELDQHHALELQLLKDQHQAELVEATRTAVQQTEGFHRFKKAAQGQVESLQKQLEEAHHQIRDLQKGLSNARATSDTLSLEVRNERLQNERLVSDRDQVIPELEKRLIHLQGQVDEAHQLRSKLKHRDELYKILEDELLEALDHIEVLEEFESAEIRERDEALRTMTEKNEALQSQLEEAVLLAEQSTGQLVVAQASLAELTRMKESASRLVAVAKSLLQSRLSSKHSDRLDDLDHPLPDAVDATSILAIVERFEGIHAQVLLDEALDDGLSSHKEDGSFTSTSASRSSHLPSTASKAKGRGNLQQGQRVPSTTRHIETPSQKPRTQTDSTSIVKPHRTSIPVTPHQATNENARNGPSSSARRLSMADSARGSSLKPPSANISKITRPQPGKQRSLLQKYGSRSVLQEQARTLPTARRGIPSSTALPIDRKVSSSRSSLPAHAARPPTADGSESLEWTDVGRPIDSANSSSWGHRASDERPESSAGVTASSDEALALGWSNVGRSGDDLLDGIQSQPTLAVNTTFSEDRSDERKGSSFVKSHAQESSRISPKVLLRNVVKSLSPRSPSDAAVQSMESEHPLPAEAIDKTPHESNVETKFEFLFAGWSCSKGPSEVFSPTSMLPASLQFSTAKKSKREGGGLGFAVASFPATVSSVAAAPPSSKRMKVDEVQATATPGRHETTGSATHWVPAIIERELAASFTTEESLLSPYPARKAGPSYRSSSTASRTPSIVSTASSTPNDEEPTKLPSTLRQEDREQESVGPLLSSHLPPKCINGQKESTEHSDSESFGPSFSQCQSATVIARTYKMYKGRTGFLRKRNMILRLQAFYRAYAARSERQKLHELASATAIQGAWRCSYHRRKYLGTIRSALILQSVCRMFLVRRQKLQMTRSIDILQAFARRTLDANKRRVTAVVILQRAWRHIAARKSYKGVLRGITLVQSIFRGARMRQEARELMAYEISSSTRIQARWRRYRARKNYNATQKAVLILQTFFRQLAAKNRLSQAQSLQGETLRAVTRIQSSWRSYFSQRRLIHTRRMALLLQSLFRGFTTRQRLKAKFALESAICTTIQSSWRRRDSREKYKRARKAAVLMQAVVRAYLANSKFNRLKDLHVEAAVAIQKSWRSCNSQRTYVHKVCTILILQSFFRGCSTRQHLKRRIALEGATCTKIQAVWRRHVVRAEYRDSRKSIVLFQAVVRATMAKRKTARLHESRVQAAFKIQQSWRRCSAQRRFRQAVRNVVALQSWHRACSTRKRLLKSKIVRQEACIRIQASWRCRISRQDFLMSKQSIIQVQTTLRVYLAKTKSKQIQRVMAQERIAARCIQTAWRCSSARKSLVVARSNARLIQTVFRAHHARRSFRKKRQELASTRIQACWNCWKSRQKYDEARRSILRLQSFVRWVLAKSRRQKFLAGVVRAAVIIQSFWRRIRAHVKDVNTLQKLVLLQAQIRGKSSRRRLKTVRDRHTAATRIQQTWNGRRIRLRYLRLLHAVVCAQSLFRGSVARAMQQQLKRDIAALVLQRALRCWTSVTVYSAILSSTKLIQAILRGYIARRRLNRLQEQRRELAACLKLQAMWRTSLHRNRFILMKSAAATIADFVRLCTVQRCLIIQRMSAEKLQARVRGRTQRSKFQITRRSAIRLQALVRMLLAQDVANSLRIKARAVVTIQSALRRFMARQQLSTGLRAVLVIQKTFRGYFTYRRCLAIRLAAMENHRAMELTESDTKSREDQHAAPFDGSNRPSRRSTRSIDVGVQCAASEDTARKPLGNVEVSVKQSNSQAKVRATRSRAQSKLPLPSLDESTPREEVEKLKVQELRDILRSRGVESKLYRNLRKADLVKMVLD